MAHWDRLLQDRLHFVLMVRHPADIIASSAETPMAKVISTSLEGRCAHVHQYLRAGLDYVHSHPERSTMVRYEALVSHPEQTLATLMAALDEVPEPTMLESLGGNHGPGIEDPKARTRPSITDASVERWKQAFEPAEIATIRDRLGDLLEQLGYTL